MLICLRGPCFSSYVLLYVILIQAGSACLCLKSVYPKGLKFLDR